jgi:hypothetical protein
MWRRLGIQRGERTLFAWGAACLLLLGFADASVRNASETLFVKRVGPGVLPIAILLSSLVLVATTSLVARLAARPDRTRLLPALLVILAGALVPLWLMIHGDVGTSARAGAAALFIASKELQSLGLLAFLLALGDLVHPRQAKRLLAPLLAALTLGAILGSFASRPLGNALGIAGLLPLAGGLLIAAAACAVPLRRVRPPRLGRGGPRAAIAAAAASAATPNGDGKLARLWRESRLFRLLAGVTASNALLAPMLYVQFQFVADLATQGSDGEARLLAINSALRGWISVGILAIQLGFASRLFRRIGLPLSTALSPLFYVLGFLGLTWRVDLAVGMSAMASTRLVDTALFDPALRVLYNLFHERVRPRASALLEGPIKRGAGAAGAAITQGAIAFGGAGVIALRCRSRCSGSRSPRRSGARIPRCCSRRPARAGGASGCRCASCWTRPRAARWRASSRAPTRRSVGRRSSSAARPTRSARSPRWRARRATRRTPRAASWSRASTGCSRRRWRNPSAATPRRRTSPRCWRSRSG